MPPTQLRRTHVPGTLAGRILAALTAIGACATALTLTACTSTPASGAATGAEPSDTPGATAPLLTTAYPVTVLEDAEGVKLCFGGVRQSYPPQCGGPVLIGWDWDEHDGEFEEASGVRWGDFIVTGRYDAEAASFTPTEARSDNDYEWPADDTADHFTTPCAEPEGGWHVLDESRTTQRELDAVLQAATTLDGYGSSWVDQSLNPAQSAETHDDAWMQAMNDPLYTIINVRVTGGADAAEAMLRKNWGGMLCVSEVERSEAELLAIQDELIANDRNGLLSSGPEIGGFLSVQVIYDEGGALQRELDDRYGEGAIEVSSVLQVVG